MLTIPRGKFSSFFDSEIFTDGPGSLRVESITGKVNEWSWMESTEDIRPGDGQYRVTAWIKTQNTVQSHVAVVGRDSSGNDIYMNGGTTDQLSIVPSEALDGTNDWQFYRSREFNPIKVNTNIQSLVIGINAGWSPDGQSAISWFDDVELQYCPN
jgi:hypothetical protein